MVTFDEFRAMALALPQATQQPTWETETLRVDSKIFAMGSPDGDSVTVKASREDQAELLAAEPEVFSSAPYVGRHGWVSVRLDLVDRDELRDLLTEAWRRAAPKRLVREFGAGPESGPAEPARAKGRPKSTGGGDA
ncbi:MULTISPECIES: MmcQ/YjbR family DNA-binding protein [unclassified Streptomyces]|uniref:MmcQ/YjbR family DNA-binding protein n=1 Tax=Streptomycetaceae TaxID=2062 RepID=UPI002E790FAB|nr:MULTISPECIES: MmcQ/YjbR family DNA-binding protein [unclassified Streptomyces]MED7953392.1 MmcQ/YjbR family DNA-binding protein [Streptomyces sp. BE303]MEE1823142.1 MmcQ/YjbR family DNA-binding protein [Streptomyces sp. BE20]